MSLNVRRFTTGIQLVPVSSVTIDKAGELSFSTSTNQFFGHNGTSPLALSTISGTETLTNKTLTSPILNTPTADTITGIAGGPLVVQSASGQNLTLQAQGSGVSSLLGTSVTIKDTVFTSNTITGVSGVDLSIKSSSNQNLILQGQGSGTVHISPELRLDGSSSGYIGIKSTSAPTSYTMILPSAQGAANTVLQNDGAGNLSWSSVASGANAALSNLASVAINTDLLPSGVNNRDLGSSSLPFRNSFAQRIFLTNGTGNLGIFDGSPQTMPDGSTAAISISNTNSQDLVGIMTGLNTAADGTPSGDIRIESGNKTAGTGNSGNIVLQTGTSSGGTRGSVKVNGNGINVKGAAFIGASNEIQSTALTDGQLLVGSTGNTPVATTITAGTGISVTNGAGSITIANTGIASPNSEVWVQQGNQWGSTNTYIRRFSNTVTSTGSDISYSDSATLGGSFTINTTGIYAVSYWDIFTGIGFFGITRNGTQLSTGITSISNVNEAIVFSATPSGNVTACASTTLHLSSGDVLRAQTDAVTQSGFNQFTAVRITRVG